MPVRNKLEKGQRIGVFTGTGHQRPYHDKQNRLRFYYHEVICPCGNRFFIKWHLLKKQTGCRKCKGGSIRERFFHHVRKTRGCWYWKGYITKDGIPVFSIGGKSTPAYRVVYEWFRGPLNKGQRCLRTCGNKSCVNPAHLKSEPIHHQKGEFV